jgi:hypothetical protein
MPTLYVPLFSFSFYDLQTLIYLLSSLKKIAYDQNVMMKNSDP